MTTTYVIQSQQSNNYCIGVTNGSNVSLLLNGSLKTQWLMDPTTGFIRLASDPNLYLDVSSPNQQLIVNNFVPGRVSQQWNWVANPPFIANQQYPAYVIDNSGNNVTPGNPILLWQLNNGLNQKWNKLDIANANVSSTSLANANVSSTSPSLSPNSI